MARDFEDHCWRDVVGDEALMIYRAYARDTFVGEKPALLAIDLYNLAYDGGPRPVHQLCREYPSTCGEFAWAAIPPTQRLFAAARAAGIPVIYSTVDRAGGTRVEATNRRVNRIGERSFEIRDEFKPQPDDLTVAKQRASVFYGTPILAHLVKLGVRSLIVCGESTSGCVRASVVDAYSSGYHTVVAEECTFDRHLLSHKVNLFDMHHKYADVMHVDEVVAHLNGLVGLRGAVGDKATSARKA
jgi:nicotinamidase-related amidase